MGCGSSSAKGRENYATLSPEPESLTPLFSSGEVQELPRLDSFIAPLPTESPTPSRHNTSFPQKQERQQKEESVPFQAEDPFDDFPTPKNFDSSFPTVKGSFERDIDSISFPSLPDPPLAASSASKAAARQQGQLQAEFGEKPPEPSLSSVVPPSTKSPVVSAEVKSPPKPKQSLDSLSSGQNSSGAGVNTSAKESKKKKKKRKSVSGKKKDKDKASSTKESKESKMSHKDRPEDTPQPSSESGMRFEELYRLRGVLGTGAFSTVREGYHRSSESITYAVKCVNRRKLSEEDEKALLDEVDILREMKHIHIIRLYDFFVEQSTYYLVMERMSGGELFDRIVAKAYYNEKEARDVCKILLEAVCYCHDNNVAHRDLKPENLLLLSEDDDSTVKIADFGFAKKVYSPQSLTTQCGTPGYVAPEILEGIPYDTRADMWSVGVILYILLGGYPPFIENNQRDLFRKIRRGEYEFHEEYWGTVSVEAKELISSLLTVDPNVRLNATQALENPWIRVDDDVLAKRDLGANLKELTKYNAKRKFKAAVSTVMAVNKLQSLGKDFLKNLNE